MATQTQYQEHVRAARAWLGRAEDSLAQEDHIRGDLDVMLAQAELQRAQEVRTGAVRHRWLRRLFSVGAASFAAVLAFGVWLSLPPPAAEHAPMVRVAEPETKVSAAMSPVVVVQREREAPFAPTATAAIPSPMEDSPFAEAAQQAGEVAMEPSDASLIRVPTQDMQKLMSAAGQKLREQ